MKLRFVSRRAVARDGHPCRKPVALAVAAALGGPLATLAGPLGPTVVNGTAVVTQPAPGVTLVKQASDKAIINWRSFSIGAGEQVQFRQPGSNSVALNRVTTAATPSEIYGSLSANGKIFLINPAGVVFGRNASVDVGSLVASTLDLRDDDFLAGRYGFADGGAAGAVRNQGRISARDGGTVALLGARVGNDGTISARLGTVGLAAGSKVTLDFGADGLTRIVVDAARINALVENGGAILSEGGQVTMTARALDALAGTVVGNTGVVGARSLVERDGRIVLDGGDTGKVIVGGTLDASGLAGGQHGGAVTVLGHDILLERAGAIDARGEAGGGTVSVGGARRGADASIPRAASTTMDAGSSIRADALGSGNGGTIVLWSDGLTTAKGSLSARGGGVAGDGGIIETSGARVDVGGLKANAAAAHGKAGTWLLDPTDVTIDAAMARTISDVLDTGTSSETSSDGSILVAADITKTAGGDAMLTLKAVQDIVVGDGVKISSTSGKLNVDFNANSAGNPNVESSRGSGAIVLNPNSSILTNGGDIRLYGQSDPANGSAIGSTQNREGILIGRATLNTRDGGGTGAHGGQILMRGIGLDRFNDDGGGYTGVWLDAANLDSASGSIRIEGQGGSGAAGGGAGIGVELALGDYEYGGSISTTDGAIFIHGIDGSVRFVPNSGAPLRDPYGAPGVRATLSYGGSITTAGGDIVVRGDSYLPGSEGSFAVDLFMYGGEIASGGRLQLTGIAHVDAIAGLYIHGSYLAPALSAGAGGMILAGRNAGSGNGLWLDYIATNTTGGGQITLAGESASGSGVALAGVTVGGAGMTGDIALRAYGGGSAPMLSVASSDSTTALQTAGTVSILPGGVDTGGNLTTRADVPITVGSGSAGGFGVSFATLGLGVSGTSRVVVGSREQQAAITYNDPALFAGALTLQNDAAGSAGIRLGSDVNVTGQLTLSSGGTVTANNLGDGGVPTITAARLLLHGSMPESNFQLAASGNQVGQFGAVFDQPKSLASPDHGDVNFSNSGALAVASLSGAGFSAASNAAISLNAPDTVVAGDLVLRTSGNLTLGQDVSTLGSDITLVTGGVFSNPGNRRLRPGADGNWRIFADTWVDEARGGLTPGTSHPNLYNCSYASSCSDGVGGNHFFYRAQPVLTITPDRITRTYGDANPALTYSGNPINGDTLVDAASGSYATAALASSPVGTYATTAGTFTSPVGYRIETQPGTLTVTPAQLLVTVDDKHKVYGEADPLLTASFSGFKLGETASVVSGLTLSAPSGAGATAGTHPIGAANASAANYTIAYVPGVLSVDPALLTYVANPASRFQDAPLAPLSGSVTGFAYGDTLASATTGVLAFSSPATRYSAPGAYAIQGSGLSAANYRFVQAASNDTALTVYGSPALLRPTFTRDVTFESSNVYEKNFGTPHVCVAAGALETGLAGADANDILAIEWSRVRVSPNLSNCLGLGQRNGCGDF